MKRILVMSIPHKWQAYETVGNYFEAHGCICIQVSEMGNEQYEQLVAVHELIEKILVSARGVSDDAITAFDTAFEAARAPGNDDEPGDDPDAPYHREHVFATRVERLLAAKLGIHWDEYERTVLGLRQ